MNFALRIFSLLLFVSIAVSDEVEFEDYDPSSVEPINHPRPVLQFPWWHKFHKSLIQEANDWKERGGLDVLFLGDTVVETWRGTEGNGKCVRCNGVPHVFNQYYGNIQAAAFGIAWDEAPHVLWRIKDGELPKGLKVKNIVVMTGGNDIAKLPARTVNETADSMLAIVDYIRTSVPSANVVVVGILPRGKVQTVGQQLPIRQDIAAVNDLIEEALAEGADDMVQFVDCGLKFLDTQKSFIMRMLMPDYKNPSMEGHEELAKCLQPYLVIPPRQDSKSDL